MDGRQDQPSTGDNRRLDNSLMVSWSVAEAAQDKLPAIRSPCFLTSPSSFQSSKHPCQHAVRSGDTSNFYLLLAE